MRDLFKKTGFFGFTTTIFLFSACQAPSNAPSSPAAVAFDREDLKAYLVKTMAPAVSRLDTDLDAYHYVDSERFLNENEVLTDPGKNPGIQSHLQDAAARYFTSLETPGGEVGGLYTAIDPISSITYGGDEWLLYRVHLTQELKVIDLTQVTDVLPTDRVKQLAQAGCD